MTTPAQNAQARAQLRQNSGELGAQARQPSSNAGQCIRALAQALASSITPTPSALVVDGWEILLARAFGGKFGGVLQVLGGSLPTYSSLVGPLPEVILPGGGGIIDEALPLSYIGDGFPSRPIVPNVGPKTVTAFFVVQGLVAAWFGAHSIPPPAGGIIYRMALTTGIITPRIDAGVFGDFGLIANPTGSDAGMNEAPYPYVGIAWRQLA